MLFFLLLFPKLFIAQQVNIPLSNELNYRIEKCLFKDTNFYSDIKPFRIKKIVFDSIKHSYTLKTNRKNINNLFNNHLITKRTDKLLFTIEPIITILPEYNSEQTISGQYQFGINANAYIGKKLNLNFTGFYSFYSFNNYWSAYIDSTHIIPHYGKYQSNSGNNYGFWSINGFISYQAWKYFIFETGKGKNFLGKGYRSLFLSDNSNSYPYFKTSVAIWKFRYIWLISALRDENSDYPGSLKNKVQFTHYLSWNATKWLNINFFESIISNPVDSVGVNYFNINYLNPVIFYRPIEFAGGSADNALMGMGLNIRLWKKYQFYTQFLIDEFVISEIKSGNAWWGNKFGLQAGMKVFDLLGLKNLMFIGELNVIRPYTYSHQNSIMNYGNYHQAMAHPTGANLKEAILLLHYHKKRFSFQIKSIIQQSGLDTNAISLGKNIYKSYNLRPSDYGHFITQGLKTNSIFTEIKGSWILNSLSNTQIQLKVSGFSIANNQYSIHNISVSLGIRTFIFNNNYDYMHL